MIYGTNIKKDGVLENENPLKSQWDLKILVKWIFY